MPSIDDIAAEYVERATALDAAGAREPREQAARAEEGISALTGMVESGLADGALTPEGRDAGRVLRS
jgi:hypothetical protein